MQISKLDLSWAFMRPKCSERTSIYFNYLHDLPWSSLYGHQTMPYWMWWHRRLFQCRSKEDAIFCLWYMATWSLSMTSTRKTIEKHQIHCTITTLFVIVWSDSTFFSKLSFVQSIFIEWVVCARHCAIHPQDEIHGTQSQEVQRLVRKATCKCMDFNREQQGL